MSCHVAVGARRPGQHSSPPVVASAELTVPVLSMGGYLIKDGADSDYAGRSMKPWQAQ